MPGYVVRDFGEQEDKREREAAHDRGGKCLNHEYDGTRTNGHHFGCSDSRACRGKSGSTPNVKRAVSRTRILVVSLALNLALSLAAIGWVAWIAASPRHWFPDAYSQQGPRGKPGPQGPVGLPGPTGPVGPDAADAIDQLSSQLDDLETGSGDNAGSSVDDLSSTVDDLSSRLDDLETGSGDQASSSVDDLTNTVSGMCDAFLNYSGAFSDIYAQAC